ncbi:hypothetical protein D5018_05800 [Parashewanella curva]|uniref:Ankyrin repeat domain-containing protein n=1 Tax=Parashewanella curva TaxID=2338552 RepID=A0A3L8PZ11_9GAMM|nr:ankyrin repeat domain-containing protein [Parashewanella curva]RLV60614.1 hypothetical protein D5018_05800 [Parashewanella curva]
MVASIFRTLVAGGSDNTPIEELHQKFLDECSAGNLTSVKTLCSKVEVDDSLCDSNGLNGLHLACKNGHVEVVKRLIKSGYDINAPTNNEERFTALHIAISEEKHDVVEFLMTNGANPSLACASDEAQPIHLAVGKRNAQLMKSLLSVQVQNTAEGINCLAKDSNGKSAFSIACEKGDRDIVGLMLEFIFRQDSEEQPHKHEVLTALILLLPPPQTETTLKTQELVKDNFKAVNKVVLDKESTTASPVLKQLFETHQDHPLEYAALCNDQFVFESLTKYGLVAVSALTLEAAVWSKSLDITKKIITQHPNFGTDTSAAIDHLPICYIAVMTDAEMTEILYPCINKIGVTADCIKYRALGYAVLSHQLKCVKCLVPKESDLSNLSATPNECLSAIHLAIRDEECLPVLEYLLDYQLGSKEQSKPSAEARKCLYVYNHNNHPPLYSALFRGKRGAASMLLARMKTDEFNLGEQYKIIKFLHNNKLIEEVVWLLQQELLLEMPLKEKVLFRLYEDTELVHQLVDVRVSKKYLGTPDWVQLLLIYLSRKEYQHCEYLLKIDRVRFFFAEGQFYSKFNFELFLGTIGVDGLKFLIQTAKIKVNKPDENGCTLLFYVVGHSLEFVAFLLNAGAIPGHKNKNGKTAFEQFVGSRNPLSIEFWQLKILLTHPAVIGHRLLFKWNTPPQQKISEVTFSSEESKKAEEWFQLLQDKSDVAQLSAWLESTENESKYLNLYKGVTGQASVHIAVYQERYDCLPIFERHGANLLFPTQVTKNTIMHQAAMNNKVELAKLYCQDHRFYSLTNSDGRTLIMEAIHFQHFQKGHVLDIFLEHRPIVDDSSKNSVKAEVRKQVARLQRLLWCDYEITVFQETLNHSLVTSNINIRDFELNYTAVDVAVIRGKHNQLRLLFEHKARVEKSTSSSNENLLHLLLRFDKTPETDQLETWSVLISNLKPNMLKDFLMQKNKSGFTPMELAERVDKSELLQAFQGFLESLKK